MPYKDLATQREYQRRWMAARRAEYLAGKRCAFCNSDGPLEIHHFDPAIKVHHAIWSWSQARREATMADLSSGASRQVRTENGTELPCPICERTILRSDLYGDGCPYCETWVECGCDYELVEDGSVQRIRWFHDPECPRG